MQPSRGVAPLLGDRIVLVIVACWSTSFPIPFPAFIVVCFCFSCNGLGALTQLLSKFKRILLVGFRVGSISSSFGSPVVAPRGMRAQEMAGNRA